MWQAIENLSKRISSLFIIVGLLLVLLGFVNGLTTNSFSIPILDATNKALAIAIGSVFSLGGAYLEYGSRFRGLSNDSKDFKVLEFSNRKEYTEYRMRQLRKAKRVDDVTWRFRDINKQPHSGGDNALRKEEMDLISQLAKKPDVVWRGVAVFTSLEHLERELPLISEIENTGYNFGVYEINPETSPPLSGFMIIDGKELFIAYPPKSIRLVIQHPSVIKLFSEYFDDIWQSAHKVKLGNNIDFKKLQHIEDDLRKG